MEIIGMYGTTAATANNIANIPVPRRGKIRGLQYSVYADLDADGEAAAWELSLLPVFQSTTNNTRNLIATFRVGATDVAGAGLVENSINGFVPLNIDVDPLQILYMNAVLAGTGASEARFLLHFD